MKKIINVFLLVIGIFAIGGCSNNSKVVTDVSSLEYLDSTNNKNIAHNLGLVASKIKSVSFTGNIQVSDKTYAFSGELILNDSLEESLLHIKYEDSNLYLKDGNVYLSHRYNNTNIVVKDDLDTFVNEIASVLEYKGIKCDSNKIKEVLSSDILSSVNFSALSEMVDTTKDGYVISGLNSEMNLNEDYLPTSYVYTQSDISLNVNFSYFPVMVKVPFGYNLLNYSIGDVKEILGVNSISEILK